MLFKKCTVISDLTPDDVIYLLQNKLSGDSPLLKGEIKEDSFTIQRNLKYGKYLLQLLTAS